MQHVHMASSRIEASLEQLTYTRGVVGIVVCNTDGIPIRDTFQDMQRQEPLAYASFAADLVKNAAPVSTRLGELQSIRVRTSNNEVIVRTNGKYIVCIVQEPDTE